MFVRTIGLKLTIYVDHVGGSSNQSVIQQDSWYTSCKGPL